MKIKIPQIKIPDFKKIRINKQTIFIIALALIVLLVIIKTTTNMQKVLFKKKEVGKKEAVTFQEEAIPVKVYKVKKIDFKDTLPVIGNIKGFKEVDLKFSVNGIIESFNFEEGEKIQEGDIIASLVQKDGILKLKYSELEMKKQQKLYELGAIGQTKAEQAKLEYESAKSDLDKTNIYAMTNGFLGAKTIDAGSFVSQNDKVGSFVSIDKVYAEFNIIEKDVPKLALGQRVEVFVDAFPTKNFSGTVDRISPIIEGRSRTQMIKVEIDNKDEMLKPGMFTRGLIATYEKKEALVIPASGLRKQEADYFIFVVHKEQQASKEGKKEKSEKAGEDKKGAKQGILGKFFKQKKPDTAAKPEPAEPEIEYGTVEVRKVKLGYMTQDLAEIAEGVKEDELLIVEIQEELKDKSKVEISEVQEGIF